MSDTKIKIGSLVKIKFVNPDDFHVDSPSGRRSWFFKTGDVQYGEVVESDGETIVVKLGKSNKTEPISVSNPNLQIQSYDKVDSSS